MYKKKTLDGVFFLCGKMNKNEKNETKNAKML